MNPEFRIIKKYPNRRLYDTQTCSYITLEAVKDIVLNHIPFKVIDVKTSQDVTQAILLQIIHDEESESAPIFTTEILQNLIRFYGHPLQKDLSQWLDQCFSSLAQSTGKNHPNNQQPSMEKWREQQTFMFNAASQMAKQNLSAWESFFELQTNAKKPVQTPPENEGMAEKKA